MGDIVVCKKCKKWFDNTFSKDYCSTCRKEMGDVLTEIKHYIKENYKERIGMRDVADKFDVSVAQIISWVNQGELDLKRDIEFNFKCRKCGIEIFQSGYCEKCKKGLIREVSNSFEVKSENNKISYNKDNPKMRFITK